MRKSLLFLVAATAAAATATPATAAIEPFVRVVTTGSCPTGYSSAANVNDAHVCTRNVTLNPDAQVSRSGCPTGYTEVGSAAVDYWVCVSL